MQLLRVSVMHFRVFKMVEHCSSEDNEEMFRERCGLGKLCNQMDTKIRALHVSLGEKGQ